MLRPYSSIGLPTALTYGGMSWLTRDHAADEGVGADGDELVHGVEPAEDGAVLDGDVARELGAVGDDDAVTDVTIMGEVDVAHDETVAPHPRDARAAVPAVDRGVLPDDGALADLDPGLLALILEVLRIAADAWSRRPR